MGPGTGTTRQGVEGPRNMGSCFVPVLRWSKSDRPVSLRTLTCILHFLNTNNPLCTQFRTNGILSNSDIFTARRAFLLFEILDCSFSDPRHPVTFSLIVQTYIHANTKTRTYKHTHTDILLYIHRHSYRYIQIHSLTQTQIHIGMYIQICRHKHTHIHTDIHT